MQHQNSKNVLSQVLKILFSDFELQNLTRTELKNLSCYSEGEKVFCREIYSGYKICGSPDAVIPSYTNGLSEECINILLDLVYYKGYSEIPVECKRTKRKTLSKSHLLQLFKYLFIFESDKGFLVYSNSEETIVYLVEINKESLNFLVREIIERIRETPGVGFEPTRA